MGKRLSIAVEDSNLKFILYYTKMSIEFCFKKITDLLYNESVNLEDSRYITAIAGPPGCGKSSIAQLFAHLFKRDYNVDTIILPLDGFHYENDYLKSQKVNLKNRIVTLYDVKGALAGFLYAHYVTFLSPGSFSLNFSILLVTMVAIGGMENIWGAFLGTAILTLLPEYLRFFKDFDILIYGAILMSIMLLRPEGLYGIKIKIPFLKKTKKEN